MVSTENKSKPQNRFNLIDEPWIPIADTGQVSLGRVFQDTSLKALGGDAVQKISVFNLLIAICQATATPTDNKEWKVLGPKGLAGKVLAYLKNHHDDFYLFGSKPFLQIPAIIKATKQPFGAVKPDIATGNTTVLTQAQQERSLSDAEKALLVVRLMGFALGGKKTDNSVVLSPGYQGKTNEKGKASTGKPGPSIGFLGYLHNFFLGTTLMETLWLNLLTKKDIEGLRIFPEGIGPIPWETPPKGENDPIAKSLKKSLMGRLVPFSRFLLLAEDGIHYSEGILHPAHKEGMIDPSVAWDRSGKEIRALWTDPSKRPWRNLTSMLGFLGGEGHYFDCPYISLGFERGKKNVPILGLWSGGLRVSSNAGEQYVSGTDDYVESEVFFDSNDIGEYFYDHLKREMGILDEASRLLYGRIMGYYKELKAEGETHAKQASELYWQLCERRFQDLVYACEENSDRDPEALRPVFLQFVRKVYETYCPRDSARQLEFWSKHYPNLGKFYPKKTEKV